MLDAAIDAPLFALQRPCRCAGTVAAHPEQIAGIILDPIPHNIGAVCAEQEFLEGLLRTLCDERGDRADLR